jgi:hypothetical protein
VTVIVNGELFCQYGVIALTEDIGGVPSVVKL